MNVLNGWKTKIGAALLFVSGGLLATGVIDQGVFEILAAFAGSLMGVGLYSKLSRP